MFGQQQLPGVCAQELSAQEDTRSETLQHNPPAEWRKSIEQEKLWKKVSNLPIVMTEATANIPCVMQMAADYIFGGEETVLLDIDYLKIPDTSATRGEEQNNNGQSHLLILILITYTCQ